MRLRDEIRPMLQLGLPLIFAELGWMCMGIVDTIMVGRLPNSAVAIGATSLGGVIFYTVAISGMGFWLGWTPLSHQGLAEEKFRKGNAGLVKDCSVPSCLRRYLWLTF